MTEIKQPKIRFKGYIDNWEQCKLKDVSEMYDNLRVPITASDRVAGDTPYYGANGIQDYVEGYTHNGEYVLIAEDGANDLLNYPVNYVNDKVWINNHAHVVSGKLGELNNLFLVSRIKSMNIVPWLVGGGRAKLNGDVLKKLPILIPIFEEQVKIGNFFKHLDDTIALHQQKLEVTKQFKQAMLKKMFPKNGETTPEIRFKGFTEDWEECKLGDLCSLSTGKLDANAMTSDGKYTFFTSGEKVYKTDTFAFNGDAILITGNGNVGLQHTYSGKFNAYQRTYVLMDFEINKEILSNQIAIELPRVIARETRVGVIPYIVKDMLTELPIRFPKNIKEQDLISKYFNELNREIKYLEFKSENLLNLKKTLLKKLFI